MRTQLLAFSLSVLMVACSSTPTTSAAASGSGPKPGPSDLGALTIRPDTGLLVVGRRLRVVINAVDEHGVPIDAANTEVTSSNPSVAQFAGAIAIPIAGPPISYLNALVASFDLNSAGSTAIRARLGLLADSVVISVVPPT